jgi:MraZ protein
LSHIRINYDFIHSFGNFTVKFDKKSRNLFIKYFTKGYLDSRIVVYSVTLWGKVGDFMFMGEYHHTIDDKGRLTIPSKIRYELGENFVVTRGLDGCLFVYPKNTWDKIVVKYQELPNVKDARNFMRFFLSGAVNQEFDKQGRINISSPLMKYADLAKDCVVIGVGDRLEIWSAERWNSFIDENEDSLSDIADNLFSSNLNI